MMSWKMKQRAIQEELQMLTLLDWSLKKSPALTVNGHVRVTKHALKMLSPTTKYRGISANTTARQFTMMMVSWRNGQSTLAAVLQWHFMKRSPNPTSHLGLK